MRRRLVAIISVAGGLVFSVFALQGGTVAEQTAFLADAGIQPNRDAVCPVRLDPDFAADAGLGVYQRLLFPVRLLVMADGGRDVQMPPVPVHLVRDAIDVVDWGDCTLSASTAPVAALWGTRLPFQRIASGQPWCRAKLPVLPCLLTDGGVPDSLGPQLGGPNIGLCSLRAAPATCERVSGGVVYLGDDPEAL
jgi:hypothetical protein